MERNAAKKRSNIEFGSRLDLHGQGMTKACRRAVRDAISRGCLCGLLEIIGLRDLNDLRVAVLLATPAPEKVDIPAVLVEIPFGRRKGRSVAGGLQAPGRCLHEKGDPTADLIMANAAVTVWVEVD